MTALLFAVLLHSVQSVPAPEPIRLYVGLPTDMIIDAGDRGADERSDTVADIVRIAKKDKKPLVLIVNDKADAQAEFYVTHRAFKKTGRRVKALFVGWTDELAHVLKGELRVGSQRFPIEVDESESGEMFAWNWSDAAGRLLHRVETFIENNRALLFAK